MKQFTDYLNQQHLANSTQKEIQRAVKHFIHYMEEELIPENECSYNDVLAYVQQLQQRTIKPSYLNSCIKSIQWYFKYLVYAKQRSDNPALDLKIKGAVKHTVIHLLKEEELEQLYSLVKNSPYYRSEETKLRDTILMGLIVYQGLQVCDLKALLITDINVEEGVIHIPDTNRTKERLLKLDAKQMLPLVQYIHLNRQERLFEVKINDHLELLFERLKNKFNSHVTYKQIRASRILIWISQHPIRMVQYYTGMKYISSLKKYQQQQIDGLKDKINQFHPLG